MLMVIFGAGASFDSVSPRLNAEMDLQRDRLRLPLAAELFAERFAPFVAAVPSAAPIVAQMRLASLSGGDVERRLGELQEEADRYPERESHVTAIRFYLQRVIAATTERWLQLSAGVTNYLLLLDRLLAWQRQSGEAVLLVTFNYDTMLEEALTRVLPDWTPDLNKLMTRSDVRLFKPHGSISWARLAALGGLQDGPPHVLQDEMCRNVGRLEISAEYVYRRDPLQFSNPRPGGAPLLYPAIAIPVERKASFECPASHVETFSGLVADVTKVIIVGWRATERHFLDLLQRYMAKNRRVSLHAVAERRDATIRTEQNLMGMVSGVSWIGTHAASVEGFSRFAEDDNPLSDFLRQPAFGN